MTNGPRTGIARHSALVAAAAIGLLAFGATGATASEAWVHLARAEALQRESKSATEDFDMAASLAREHGMPAILARADPVGMVGECD